jgi:hypothetical protein
LGQGFQGFCACHRLRYRIGAATPPRLCRTCRRRSTFCCCNIGKGHCVLVC